MTVVLLLEVEYEEYTPFVGPLLRSFRVLVQTLPLWPETVSWWPIMYVVINKDSECLYIDKLQKSTNLLAKPTRI